MVIDRAIYLGKNDALDDFQFVMAISTQANMYVCYYQLHSWFNVNTGAFFRPEAGCTFHCCRSALFRLENGTFSTGTTTVKNHHGGIRVSCLGTVILGVTLCYFNYTATKLKGSNVAISQK